LAQADRGMVSVGLKPVTLVHDVYTSCTVPSSVAHSGNTH
jgi:hypothetical protein